MIGRFFDRFFNKYKGVRRSVLFWFFSALTVLLIVIIKYGNVEQLINVYTITIGAGSLFTGLYMFMRNKDGD